MMQRNRRNLRQHLRVGRSPWYALWRTGAEIPSNGWNSSKKKLARATETCDDGACVYVTGSLGRGDASAHSDLDLLSSAAVGKTYPAKEVRALPNLDEILLKAELIGATWILGFQDFSGDGEYLEHYTIDERGEDDRETRRRCQQYFTARLPLLLESQVLVGERSTARRSTRRSKNTGMIMRVTSTNSFQLSLQTTS